MKKQIKVALLAIFFSWLACENPPVQVATETPMPTPVQTISVTPKVTLTELPTATTLPATATNTATGIPPIVETAVPKYKINLVKNPMLTGGLVNHDWPEINVVPGYEPFYLDVPYAPDGPVDAPKLCEEGQTEHCNPIGLKQRRPEFKNCGGVDWLIGGCQQWFCFYGTCEAGLFTAITTERGTHYKFGAIVRQWYNYTGNDDSDILTDDDKICCYWSLGVGKEGDEKSFSPDTYWSSAKYIEFEKWVLIEWEFTANSTETILFIKNTRVWPKRNNDSYITFVFAYEVDEPAPTQIAGDTPFTGAIFVFPATYTSFADQQIYTEPDLNSRITSLIDKDYIYVVQWSVEIDGQVWLYLPNVGGWALLQGEYIRLE